MRICCLIVQHVLLWAQRCFITKSKSGKQSWRCVLGKKTNYVKESKIQKLKLKLQNLAKLTF